MLAFGTNAETFPELLGIKNCLAGGALCPYVLW